MKIGDVMLGSVLVMRSSGASYVVASIFGDQITLAHVDMKGEIDVLLCDLPEMFSNVGL